jgi:hypothetical protein
MKYKDGNKQSGIWENDKRIDSERGQSPIDDIKFNREIIDSCYRKARE